MKPTKYLPTLFLHSPNQVKDSLIMIHFREQLEYLHHTRGIKKASIARSVGVSDVLIHYLITGKQRNPSDEIKASIAELYEEELQKEEHEHKAIEVLKYVKPSPVREVAPLEPEFEQPITLQDYDTDELYDEIERRITSQEPTDTLLSLLRQPKAPQTELCPLCNNTVIKGSLTSFRMDDGSYPRICKDCRSRALSNRHNPNRPLYSPLANTVISNPQHQEPG